MPIRIKNWDKYQHYRDRKPPWIKLYRELLDDYEWNVLEPVAAKALIMLWLIASEKEGVLPAPRDIAFRLRIPEKRVEAVLFDLSHWLEEGEFDKSDEPEWPSRYVSKEMRAKILDRDGNKCVWCEATEGLEIDHKIPVSKGGTGEESNLQALCRGCNRSKRSKPAEQVATQKKYLRSLETETETETEKKHNSSEPSPSNGDASKRLGWDGKFSGITPEMMTNWGKAYPAVTIPKELYAMDQWLISNPDKRKKNYYRFITNWLSRKQERGR